MGVLNMGVGWLAMIQKPTELQLCFFDMSRCCAAGRGSSFCFRCCLALAGWKMEENSPLLETPKPSIFSFEGKWWFITKIPIRKKHQIVPKCYIRNIIYLLDPKHQFLKISSLVISNPIFHAEPRHERSLPLKLYPTLGASAAAS